ncbi:MAG: T9SS type A sorting domain-containing protein [Brumimicrobium sp.]|nr:T9SS type A sorting domain-containing protein [Brumimicrobium sp.]
MNQCTEEEISNSWKFIYTYTASGKIASITEQNYNGTAWETFTVKSFEYNAQGNLIRRFYNDYSTGSVVQTRRDTIEYQGTTSNILRGIIYESTDGLTFDPMQETIFNWTGSTLNSVDYYTDDDSDPVTPMTYLFQGQYQYSGSTLTSFDVQLISGGVPVGVFGQFIYTYNAQGKLETETITGFEESVTTNTYDADGYVTEIERQVDEGAGFYLQEMDNFYYQNTAGIQKMELEASIYPVPAENILHVKTSGVINEMIVFSMDGKKLFSQRGSDQTIDVSGLSKGNYVIHVFTNEGKATVKFVK